MKTEVDYRQLHKVTCPNWNCQWFGLFSDKPWADTMQKEHIETYHSSLTEQPPQIGDNFILAQDSTPQRNKLIDTIRTLDEYETTILQAYANNLIKSREGRA